MQIKEVSPEDPIFNDVLDLHRNNSATLGHFPYQAFTNAAKEKMLLVAIDANENLLGYLLYRIAKTKRRASITHLCIKEADRGKGIAKKLIDYLKHQTKHLFGISLYSKRSYKSHSFWPKMGFVARGEKPGRGKDRENLTNYWYQHKTNFDLFEWANQQKIDSSQYNVILDANVFYDLISDDNQSDGIQSLNNDWLVGEINYCLTKEIYNEINRKEDKDERLVTKSIADQYPILPITTIDSTEFNNIADDLKTNFFSPKSDSDYSDIHQLSYAIIAKVNYFLTCDEEIIKKSETIYEKYKLEIYHPSDFISQVYDSFNEINYQPAKLAGSNIKTQNLDNSVSYENLSVFQNTKIETKKKFKQKIREARNHPERCEQILVTGTNNEYLAMMIIDNDQNNILKVPIIRVSDNELNETICTHLVLQIIEKACENNKEIILITDNCIKNITVNILRDHFFDFVDNQWIKITVSASITSSELNSKLLVLLEDHPFLENSIDPIIDTLTTAIEFSNIEKMVFIEQKLWPVKILDADIPTFIVPIKPEWAKDLFDKELGAQNLFGSKINLVISRDNVYYRSAHSIILESPARILWYISGHKNYHKVQAIKYCSYVSEIMIDIPKELFKKYRRLGIYEFENLKQISKGIDNELMAFKFNGTSKLPQQIPLKKIKEILGNNGNIQAPRRITVDKVAELLSYTQGA